MEIYFRNNADGPFFIDTLGFMFTAQKNEMYRIDEEFNYENDLLDNPELISLIEDNVITVFLANRELTITEAKEWITQQNSLEDAEDERWWYAKDSKTTIGRFKQLRLFGRPLVMEEGAIIILEEGADLIIE